MLLKRLLPCALIGLTLASTLQTQSDDLLSRLQPQGYVSDYSNVLTPQERQALEDTLQKLDQSTGAQVAVVTLSSLEGGEIQDFANRLFESWGIGRRGDDRGILVLAAVEERKIWIEVGYGLEGLLPDSRVGRILDQDVIPFFREKQYGAGLLSSVQAISTIIAQNAGVELTGEEPPDRSPTRKGRKLSCFEMLLVGILLLIGIPVLIRHPWLLFFLLSSGGRGGFSGGGFGQGGGFGGFGGGLSGGGGAGRSW